MDIRKVLDPQSFAVVGANDKPGSFGRASAENALVSAPAARTYFVNNKRTELFGKKCYSSISDLPEVVDCVVVCTPASSVLEIVREAGSLGVGGAIIFASGFGETDYGAGLEASLQNLAAIYDMAIIGPNCLGIVNNISHKALWTMGTVSYFGSRPTGIAVAGHSGFMVGNFLARLDLPISYGASIGNANCVTIEEILHYYVSDDNVRVVGAYLEGIKKPEIFEDMLYMAQSKNKPVVILKTGRSRNGSIAARYHTGNITGDCDAFDALMARYNGIVVHDVVEYASTVKALQILLDKHNFPENSFVIGADGTGGNTVTCADLAHAAGLRFAEFDDNLCSSLKGLLPDFATPKNPLDYTTACKPESVIQCYKHMSASRVASLFYTGLNVGVKSPKCDRNVNLLLKAVSHFAADQILFVVPPLNSSVAEEYQRAFDEAGIVILPAGYAGFAVIGNVSRYISAVNAQT